MTSPIDPKGEQYKYESLARTYGGVACGWNAEWPVAQG